MYITAVGSESLCNGWSVIAQMLLQGWARSGHRCFGWHKWQACNG